MNLSTKSRYAVRILTDIAIHQPKGPVHNYQIARRQGITIHYVVQLVRRLKAADLLTTSRGPKGGHRLSSPPDQITCGQVVRLLETHSDLVPCGQDAEKCKRSKDCQVRLVWMEATDALFAKLDAVTIADLAERTICNSPKHRGPPPANKPDESAHLL